MPTSRSSIRSECKGPLRPVAIARRWSFGRKKTAKSCKELLATIARLQEEMHAERRWVQVSASFIAGQIGWVRSTVQRILDLLEEMGAIGVDRSTGSRRANRIWVRQKGQARSERSPEVASKTASPKKATGAGPASPKTAEPYYKDRVRAVWSGLKRPFTMPSAAPAVTPERPDDGFGSSLPVTPRLPHSESLLCNWEPMPWHEALGVAA